jgi:hypothetical protein
MKKRNRLACSLVEFDGHDTRRGWLRAALPAHLLLGLLVACTFAGCNGDDGASPTSAPPNPTASVPTSSQPASSEGWHGRFIGKVTIGEVDYYGDAILTTDGEMRLYVADAYVGDGSLQRTKPRSSAQLVGKVDLGSGGPVGAGVVVGEHCTTTGTSRFCRYAASAEISLAGISGKGWDKELAGEIRVTTNGAEETWRLELSAWVNYYDLSAAMSWVAGLWDEQLAEFARDGDTVVRIDSLGQMFFQRAHSGCTGNGTLTPHLDGKFGVYDVSLTIEGCNTDHSSLNGDFEGLASTTASSVWNYDDVLRIWLSTREETQRVAITMLAYSSYGYWDY